MNKINIKPIKGFNTFSILYDAGIKIKVYPAYASFCKDLTDTKLNELWQSRMNTTENTIFLGVSVGKRTAKKAVVRNRIKRLLRESVRKIIVDMTDKGQQPNFKTIIINWRFAPKKPNEISLADILPKIEELIAKVEKS